MRLQRIIFSLVFGLTLLSTIGTLRAQADTTEVRNLDSVLISAGRILTPYLNIPISVTQIDLSDTSNFLSHTDLSEALSEVPGLFSLDGQNYAQDLRISIRGFGARSAFGIRGIKLIVDGIPETTPDGQGQLDNISVGDITSIEVLQSTSGSQYGNASGGVISINTLSDEKYKVKAGLRVGSYGLREYHLSTSQQIGPTLFQLGGTNQQSTGYRENSALNQSNFLSKITHEWEGNKLIWQSSYLNSPTAQDPGGINLEQATDLPRSARDRNVSFDAGEELSHWKSSLKLQSRFSEELHGYMSVFFSGRKFDGRLPFSFGGAIDLNRIYGGMMGQLNYQDIGPSSINKVSIGYEYLTQNDSRDRFVNNNGQKGNLTLSQVESFDNFGIYLLDQWYKDQWTMSGSIRYDQNTISIEDKLLTNGNDSGTKSLSSLNYSLGASYRFKEYQSAFASWSTSFETPVLSELSANPDGSGGFNDLLEPMKAKTLEIGFKGIIENRLKYTLTFFNIWSQDEFIPFELSDFPGRTFYRNAGKTKRTGIESSLSYSIGKTLTINTSYSLSKFVFNEFLVDGENLSGNSIPGIPRHALSSSLVFKKKRSFVKLSSQYFSRIYVKDDNSTSVQPYHIINVRMGYEIMKSKNKLAFFAGINNLISTDYFDNLRLNAFGGRHYEPAAKVNVQFGLTCKLY